MSKKKTNIFTASFQRNEENLWIFNKSRLISIVAATAAAVVVKSSELNKMKCYVFFIIMSNFT